MIINFISKYFELGESLLTHNLILTERGNVRSYKCSRCEFEFSFHMPSVISSLKNKSDTFSYISVDSCDACLTNKMDTAIS